MEKLQEAIESSTEDYFSDLVKVARSRRRALGLVFGDDEATLEQYLTALTANLEKPNIPIEDQPLSQRFALLKHIATLKQESDSFGSASTESYLKEIYRNAQRTRDAVKELLAVGSKSVDDIVKEKKRAAARASKQASKGS